MPTPLPSYERRGELDEFRVGILGDASDEDANFVEVALVSHDEDPVGAVKLRSRYWDDDVDEATTVFMTGDQAALLAVVLQEAARRWQERVMSNEWVTTDDGEQDEG